jgi:hypothetical protein
MKLESADYSSSPVLARIMTYNLPASDVGGTQLPAGETNSEGVKRNVYT